jgi:CRISPR-associated protein Csy3
VYPSQLFVASKTDKSRTFFQCGGQGAMTSQKIGNALRTIDNWYSDTASIGPIAVEPYGAVTSRGAAYRKGQDSNFYTLFEKWIDGKTLTTTEQHFVMAVLARGGVFGTPDEEKQAKKAAEAEAKKAAKAAKKAAAKAAPETAPETDDDP